MAEVVVKRVLMLAFHFPPVHGSSGVQRTLKFAHYLPEHDWQPLVLTVNPRAYERIDSGQLDEVGKNVVVCRAAAWDAARHLSLFGRYPRVAALPDRWASWWLGAIPAGLVMIRRYRPQVLWSTYPIATAHLIGLTLQRLTGIPWVADFRDSMTEDDYPPDPTTRKVYRWIERRAVERARYAVFTTPGAGRMYAARYPNLAATRWRVIANGYDEENFRAAEELDYDRPAMGRVRLVHSGLLYRSERDPRAFFRALAELHARDVISPSTVEIVLRASGDDAYYKSIVQDHGLHGIVTLAPPLPYREALAEMLHADGLLIFQATNCNHQIPAKLYEYLRARRPILAFTDPAGDTAGTLRAAGIDTVARLDVKDDIARGLRDFLEQVRARRAPIATSEEVARHARRARTAELAALLDTLLPGAGEPASCDRSAAGRS